MIHTIETFCPVFSGFFNSYAESIIEDAESRIADENAIDYDEGPIRYNDISFDYDKARIDISKAYCNELQRRLKQDYRIFCTITFESLHSPKEYNFTTDSINCTIKIQTESLTRLTAYLNDNMDNWREYLKDHFKSRSGFISFYSYDPHWHLENITDCVPFSHAISFMMQNEQEDIDAAICERIDENFTLNYTINSES